MISLHIKINPVPNKSETTEQQSDEASDSNSDAAYREMRGEYNVKKTKSSCDNPKNAQANSIQVDLFILI